MLTSLAINNYRSILNLVVPLGRLNLITGANASGKSNLYRALRLLAETAQGGVVNSLASEGGLNSVFWAGPETISSQMKKGEVLVQGLQRKERVRLRLGFASEDLAYSIALGLPVPSSSAFAFDPEIKHESIWAGHYYRPSSQLVERKGAMVRARDKSGWRRVTTEAGNFSSIFEKVTDSVSVPEVFQLREMIRSWRFYDHFRTDKEAPARQPQLGTRTCVLHHDGRDLAAALQTIIEIGDHAALEVAISDAFPGASLKVVGQSDGRFDIEFSQHGLLRPLSAAELSDGTLRYLLWVAALLTPRPPPLMVLNEPETSLHPDLLPALARLIVAVSEHTQVWIVSHASRLINALNSHPECHSIELTKHLGQTEIIGQGILDQPAWHWPD